MTERKFTDAEFIASDSLSGENVEDHIAISNVRFAMSHDHSTDLVIITQRFVSSKVNGEGFGEEEPKQVTMLIPVGAVEMFALMLMENTMCLIENADSIEGKGH
jgi:hypothetical protein